MRNQGKPSKTIKTCSVLEGWYTEVWPDHELMRSKEKIQKQRCPGIGLQILDSINGQDKCTLQSFRRHKQLLRQKILGHLVY